MSAEVVPSRFDACEAVIRAGLATFYDVGAALLEIREDRLYREIGYQRFEDYCRERWDMDDSYARRLLDANQVRTAIRSAPIGAVSLPANEAQVRELMPVLRAEPTRVAAVWQAAVERGGDHVTAKVVATVVREQFAAPPPVIAVPTRAQQIEGEINRVRNLTERLDLFDIVGLVYCVADQQPGRVALRELVRACRDLAYRIETDLEGWTGDREGRARLEAQIDERMGEWFGDGVIFPEHGAESQRPEPARAGAL